MQLTFLGATDTVTGSRFLLEDAGTRILVDCGMFQGLRALRRRNWARFGVPPASIDAVLITHAHLDHTGYLPALVRDGFRGDVWATPLTAALMGILLRDAAHLAEEEAAHRNEHGATRHDPARPLYTTEDAERAIQRIRTIPFGERLDLPGGFEARFSRAGHILGASCVRVASRGRSVVFTGDVGRPDDLLMLPPDPLPSADVVVTESTYGDRTHPDVDVGDVIADIVTRTIHRGGVVLVPSFAVGRAQVLQHLFATLRADGRIPDVPVHLNSPMAINVTDLFLGATGEHRLDEDACRAMSVGTVLHRSADESRALVATPGPRVIITASGMLTGGRVLHHLVSLGPDPLNTILLPGFQAAGTRGRSLQDGADEVKVFGHQVPIRAEVHQLHSLSAHADADQLLAWLAAAPKPRRAHVVHGEPGASETLRQRLGDELHWRSTVPEFGATVQV